MNEARARGRAKGTIRKKCLTIGADHLVTLTYRANVEDRERVLHDLGRLRRCLLYTSDAADERSSVDLGGRRIIKKKKKNKDTRRPM